jgi:hypothetical protein
MAADQEGGTQASILGLEERPAAGAAEVPTEYAWALRGSMPQQYWWYPGHMGLKLRGSNYLKVRLRGRWWQWRWSCVCLQWGLGGECELGFGWWERGTRRLRQQTGARLEKLKGGTYMWLISRLVLSA